MKTNIYFKSILIILIISSTFAFTSKANITLFNSQIQNPEDRIIGTWSNENSPEDKFVFTFDGKMKKYHGVNLLYIDNYSISNNCNGNIDGNGLLYLKQIDSQNGSSFCFLIANGIYSDNSNTLTLITEGQGKVIIFNRL